MAAKLQCEICGGKLVGKPGGIFECENCGTEYSTEWAKAKIQEIKGTVKVEGTVEVTGKVQIDGPVKVENAGPSAESLVKRGMMELEQLQKASTWARKGEISPFEQKKGEVKSLFIRALEIDPENGGAFWGLYLLNNRWFSTKDAIQHAPDMDYLEDQEDYFVRARQFAKGETKTAIEKTVEAWERGNQSSILPPELREDFIIRGKELRQNIISLQELTEVKIPAGVTSIGEAAFQGFEDLTYVTIPKGVIKIGKAAFYECKNLKTITIPDGVKEIGESAFRDCSALESITIPGSVKEIGESVFWGCKNLRSVEIQDGVKEIKSWAFAECDGLQSVTIPPSVTTIEWGAFESSLKYENFEIRGYAKTEAARHAVSNSFKFIRMKTEEELASEEAERRAKEAERKAKIAALNQEKATLQSELANLKGLFSGKRRREIEARIAAIEAELKTLG